MKISEVRLACGASLADVTTDSVLYRVVGCETSRYECRALFISAVDDTSGDYWVAREKNNDDTWIDIDELYLSRAAAYAAAERNAAEMDSKN
jgi:hypothetical protein